MKLVKRYPEASSFGLKGDYAVYRLSKQERELSGGKIYMVNMEYSDWAMQNLPHEELIQCVVKESSYTYGKSFHNTLEECDLSLKCDGLEVTLNNMRNLLGELGNKVFQCAANIPVFRE